ERSEFTRWEPNAPDYRALRSAISPENVLLDCSDFFICPSDVVRDDLIANWGVGAAKTVVVPYGVNAGWLRIEPHPVRNRVLFAGTAELRKGIHYLAMAASKLTERGFKYEFAVAGNVTNQIATLDE